MLLGSLQLCLQCRYNVLLILDLQPSPGLAASHRQLDNSSDPHGGTAPAGRHLMDSMTGWQAPHRQYDGLAGTRGSYPRASGPLIDSLWPHSRSMVAGPSRGPGRTMHDWGERAFTSWHPDQWHPDQCADPLPVLSLCSTPTCLTRRLASSGHAFPLP